MEKLNHRDRIEAILIGEEPDRYAASFWRHFFHMEHYAEGTIEAMVGFQKRFDWDFVKINPRADYHVEGWGMSLEWSRDEFQKHRKTSYPVNKIDDWDNIRPLDLSTPVFAEHLAVVSGVRKGVGKETPVLMTVFTPLSVAGRMVPDRQLLLEHIKSDPDRVEQALKAITDTFVRFAAELRNAGADGIFYATTHWATSKALSWEQYEKFGLPYDLPVVEATEEDALNLLHVCSSHNFLERLLQYDYRCSFLNWDSCDPTNLPLDKAYGLDGPRALVGGVDQEGWFLHSTAEEIGHQIDSIKASHDPRRLIIGPGCSVPPEVPMENYQAVKERLG